MLQSLHVKNLALLDETEVEFEPGLNILTGETGAGKSILMGSVNLALGARFDKDMLRRATDTALVELTFTENPGILRKLQEMEIDSLMDGTVVISRKLQAEKSVCKINGETVPARQVKELAEELLDIHGQHEHQSLLKKSKHMEFLDLFCGDSIEAPLEQVKAGYEKVRKLEEILNNEQLDDREKSREQALAEFELKEIEAAALKPEEDAELEAAYRRMVNGKRIMESLSKVACFVGQENGESAGDLIGRAVRAMDAVTGYDSGLERLQEQLAEIDSLLSDFNSDLNKYMTDCEFDGEEFYRVEERLNTINRLKDKYGRTIEEILAYGKEKQDLLEKLADYDAYMESRKKELCGAREELQAACDRLSQVRKKGALVFSDKLKAALLELNFLSVEFETRILQLEKPTSKGQDDVEFMISLNPGESLRPLSQVASGGELSRIMLAIKTMLAGKDAIETLIFDEIDTGISGKTAWKVSERLHEAATKHQVICITHLPQIAAMADAHYRIKKSVQSDVTVTDITRLDESGEEEELARLLGSDEITEAALVNARELKAQAGKLRKKG